jgi:hypothetical protein
MRYKIGNESELPEPKPDPSTIATFAPSGSAPARWKSSFFSSGSSSYHPKNFAFFH